MRLFSKTKKNPGWMAVGFQNDGVRVAHITRPPGGAPVVELLGFFPGSLPVSAAALEKITKDLKADGYECSTFLSSGEYQILSVEAPNVPAEELKTAIRWRLKDMLDYHIDDATIDVMDIPPDKNAPARNHSMFVVAARNSLVRERQALFEQAKFPLSAIDVQETAQRNISQLLEPPGRGLALLSFDNDGGLLTVTYGGELYLTRRIDVPIAQLQQADDAKRSECFDRITLELQRSLDHFDRQFNFVTMSKLLLGPMGTAGTGLQEYLAANLYLPVDTLNLDGVLDISKVPELRDTDSQRLFFLVLGAALRYEEKAL
jgi:MSHA biogenesis protein MshI